MKLLTTQQKTEIAFLKSQMHSAAEQIQNIAQEQGQVTFVVQSCGGLIDVQVIVESVESL
jgi:DNA-binding protein YbaB